MKAPARGSIAFAACAALACACVFAAELGMVDDLAWDATQVTKDPVAVAGADLHAFAARLRAMDASGVPAIDELLGVSAIRRGAPESLAEAGVHLRRALALRPVSPYTWSDLAMQQYRSGDTGPEFQTALGFAARLGPNEPPVQGVLADYGLAVLDELPQANRLAVESAVASGMRRAPGYFLQVAQRRGRLDVACRHFERPPRQVDSKWDQICQSMEATS